MSSTKGSGESDSLPGGPAFDPAAFALETAQEAGLVDLAPVLPVEVPTISALRQCLTHRLKTTQLRQFSPNSAQRSASVRQRLLFGPLFGEAMRRIDLR